MYKKDLSSKLKAIQNEPTFWLTFKTWSTHLPIDFRFVIASFVPTAAASSAFSVSWNPLAEAHADVDVRGNHEAERVTHGLQVQRLQKKKMKIENAWITTKWMEQNGSQNLAFLLAVQYENVRLCEVMGATPHSAVQLKINL